MLAAAGLLDGRPATTHWCSADHFQRLFPNVAVDPDVLFVDDGDVLTSAGVASGIDLCLHIVRRDHGTAVANEVARRSRGAAPPRRRPGTVHPAPGSRTQDGHHRPPPAPGRWSASTGPSPLRELAAPGVDERPDLHPALPRGGRRQPRTVADRSSASSGPGTCWRTRTCRWTQVARDAGFGTAASLRQHLQAALGVSPTRLPAYVPAEPDTAAPESGATSRHGVGSGSAVGEPAASTGARSATRDARSEREHAARHPPMVRVVRGLGEILHRIDAR